MYVELFHSKYCKHIDYPSMSYDCTSYDSHLHTDPRDGFVERSLGEREKCSL